MSSQVPASSSPSLAVRSFSYEARHAILPALAQALNASGCWLHSRKALSSEQMEYHFELQLHSAVDLYSGLVACGLELTRDSHADLTDLCALRRHSPCPRSLKRVIGVKLEVSFLDGVEPEPAPLSGCA